MLICITEMPIFNARMRSALPKCRSALLKTDFQKLNADLHY
jgi:hypothetical protein